jgi:hypothetical protein
MVFATNIHLGSQVLFNERWKGMSRWGFPNVRVAFVRRTKISRSNLSSEHKNSSRKKSFGLLGWMQHGDSLSLLHKQSLFEILLERQNMFWLLFSCQRLYGHSLSYSNKVREIRSIPNSGETAWTIRVSWESGSYLSKARFSAWRFFSREQAKSECDLAVMSSVFVASQSSSREWIRLVENRPKGKV